MVVGFIGHESPKRPAYSFPRIAAPHAFAPTSIRLGYLRSRTPI